MYRKFYVIIYIILSGFSSAQTWIQTKKVTPALSGQRFGNKVLKEGNTVFVGASNDGYDHQGQNYVMYAGSAYVYELENNVWVQKQKLVANDRLSQDYFGSDIVSTGDQILIGSHKTYGNKYDVGAIYVFKKNFSGTWLQAQKIAPQTLTAYGAFGNRISADTSTLVVGSLTNSTAVYAYNTVTLQWEFKQNLMFPNSGSSTNTSVFKESDKIFVGKRNQSTNGVVDVGQVNIYKKNQTTNQWEISQTLNPPTALPGLNFGYDLFVKDGYLFVSAVNMDNAVIIFKLNTVTDQYELQQSIFNASGTFGSEVSMDNDILVVGAPLAQNNVTVSGGAAFVYKLQNNTWQYVAKLYNNDSHPYDEFGRSVSVDNNIIVAGTPAQDFDATGTNIIASCGAFYVYENTANLSVQGADYSNKLHMYPNPFSELLNIALTNEYAKINVVITDFSGRKVFQADYSTVKNIILNLGFLTSGMYYANVYSGDELLRSSKVIKK